MEKDNKALLEIERNLHRREITLDVSNEVAMANRMILHSAGKLTLNELKLLRFIIMQTKRGDKELYEFELSAKDLAKLLEVKPKDFYKRVKTMTRHIMQEVIEIEDKRAKRLQQFHWVDYCEYKKGIITIKIADALKPFLLNLRGSFTRYELSEIIKLNSIYAIRIYEVLRAYMDDNDLPYADHYNEISISMDVLRQVTDTEKQFPRPYDFKRRVVDIAVREINRVSKYHVIAEPYKRGNTTAGFDFLIESQAGYKHRELEERAKQTAQQLEEQIEGQMELSDFLNGDALGNKTGTKAEQKGT